MSAGEKIKEYRIKAGLSQEALAERCGVSRQAVTKWEKGQSLPTAANLSRICRAVGADTDAFYRAINRQENTRPTRPDFKARVRAALIVVAVYLVVYIAGRVICSDMSDKSFIGWLFGTDSKYYLFGWLIHQKIYWRAMAICLLAALRGNFFTAAISTPGAVIGIIIGEVFGTVTDPIVYHYTHYGWLIWIVIFTLCIAAGLVADKLKRRAK